MRVFFYLLIRKTLLKKFYAQKLLCITEVKNDLNIKRRQSNSLNTTQYFAKRFW